MLLRSSNIAPILCLLMYTFACVEIPLDINLEHQFDIEAEKVDQVSKAIFKHLMSADMAKKFDSFDPVCQTAFADWVPKQLEKHQIPVTALGEEYAAGKAQPCPAIDIKSEIKIALNKHSKSTNLKRASIIDFEEYRKTIEDISGCGNNILAPGQSRLKINSIRLNISNNSLNISIPKLIIYYTAINIGTTELEALGSEANLIKRGAMKLLAQNKKAPAGFLGSLPLKLVKNADEKRAAMDALSTLRPQIIAIIAPLGAELETKKLGDQEYIIIPHGSATLNLILKAGIRSELGDALCYYNKIKRDLRANE